MKIAVLGAGNMGGAIVRGLCRGTLVSPSQIAATARTERTLAALRADCPGVTTMCDNAAAVAGADYVVVAVKPWLAEEVVRSVAPHFDASCQALVSVVAGVTLADLGEWLGRPDAALFRAIPNTAVAVGESMTFVASRGASVARRAELEALLGEVGEVMAVDEPMLETGMILASCGIAFALRYVRAAAEGGVELGCRADDAARIVAQTLKGAAELLLRGGGHPEAEIDRVTTAGGITIRGLNEMEHAGFSSAVIRGLKACRR